MKKQLLKPVKQTDRAVQKHFIQPESSKHTSVDLMLKWSPLIALLLLDAANEQRKEKLEKHLIDTAAALVLLNTAVFPLKHLVNSRRPNGKKQSFPSRHTAASFLGSELLREALEKEHPEWSYAGYAMSAATAVLRMYHQKHWFSDVLTGAVLGVLAVKLSPPLIDKLIYNTNIQPAV